MSGGASNTGGGASSDGPDPGSDAPGPARAADKPPSERTNERASAGRTEIELEISRGRSISWTILGLLFGGLLIWKLGTVGVWVGIALVATGAYHAWILAQTFLHAPGTIIVSDREVSLPRGLCLPRPVQVQPQDITAVYFLRRSVPWNHASPVLVVEIGPKAMAFPRDWFSSEADQRQVIRALLRDKPGAVKATAGEDTPGGDTPATTTGGDKPA